MVWMDGCRQKAFAPFPTNNWLIFRFTKQRTQREYRAKIQYLNNLLEYNNMTAMKLVIFWVLICTKKASQAVQTSHRNLSIIDDVIQSLDSVKSEIDSKLFLYQTPAFQWIPSTVYRYDDFRESLHIMATEGVAGKTFYTGEDVENGHVYGMVNVAAFLAQSMKETIQYDACDENSVCDTLAVINIAFDLAAHGLYLSLLTVGLGQWQISPIQCLRPTWPKLPRLSLL
jgi:hypothetical protein